MADGSIQFDTSLNPEGVISGLENLAKNAKQATKAVSDALDGGILGGLESIGVEAMTSMQTLAGAAAAAAQEMIASGSLSETEIAKIRQSAQATYRQNLRRQSEDWEDMADREFRYLKNSLDLCLISEDDYYRQLAVLRDQYFARGSDDWEKYTMEILEHNQKMVEEQKKLIGEIFEEMSEEIADNAEEIGKTQEKMAEKLSDFGGLYDNVSYKIGSENGSFMRLHDMETDVRILQEYNDALVMIKAQVDKLWTTDGVSAEAAEQNAAIRKAFFSEIRDMSVIEGLNFADMFLAHPESKINSYLEGWAEKQALSKSIAQNLYSEETTDFLEESADGMAKTMIAKLEERFGDLPDNFFEEGVAAALGFGEGFLETLDSVFTQLKAEIAAKTAELQVDMSGAGTQSTQNISNYNIYGGDTPYKTALQIEKQETVKRLLTGG